MAPAKPAANATRGRADLAPNRSVVSRDNARPPSAQPDDIRRSRTRPGEQPTSTRARRTRKPTTTHTRRQHQTAEAQRLRTQAQGHVARTATPTDCRLCGSGRTRSPDTSGGRPPTASGANKREDASLPPPPGGHQPRKPTGSRQNAETTPLSSSRAVGHRQQDQGPTHVWITYPSHRASEGSTPH
jgi:hypothetical protein